MDQGERKTGRSTDKLVMAALKRNGDISGMKALADLAHRRILNTGTDEIDLVKEVAQSVKTLSERGHISISKSNGKVTFALAKPEQQMPTKEESKVTFGISRKGKFNRSGLVLGMTGTAVLVAGCSYLARKDESQATYAPQPVYVSAMVQEKTTAGSNYWTVCQGECPQPTVKTYAPVRPVEVPVEKLVLKMEEELKSLYYLAFFKLGSADLGPYAKQSIKRMVPEAKKAKQIVITGRTDETGPVVLNLGLAQKRAEAVKAELLKAGVTAHIDIKTEIKPNSDLPKDAVSAMIPDNTSGKARRAEVEIQIKQTKKIGDVAKN